MSQTAIPKITTRPSSPTQMSLKPIPKPGRMNLSKTPPRIREPMSPKSIRKEIGGGKGRRKKSKKSRKQRMASKRRY